MEIDPMMNQTNNEFKNEMINKLRGITLEERDDVIDSLMNEESF